MTGEKALTCDLTHFVRRLTRTISHQQQTQRTLLDWLRVEYGIEKPSNKLLAVTELDSDTWVDEVKRICGTESSCPSQSAALAYWQVKLPDAQRAVVAEQQIINELELSWCGKPPRPA